MKIFDKIKNILFEDEEEIPVINKEVPVKHVEEEKQEDAVPTRFKKVNYEESQVPVKEADMHPKVEEKSPFQQFDEDEFERLAAANKNRLLERDRQAREVKEREARKNVERTYERNSNYNISKEPVKENRHFTPSPVISPVYGILDKNYKKEDILPRASSEGTLPKVIDVDKVRKKAFGTLEEDIGKNISVNSIDEDTLVIQDDSLEDELVKTSEIKITTFEDQVDDDTSKVIIKEDEPTDDEYLDDFTIEDDDPKEEIIADEPKETKPKENNETLENDLFNLIDSMYQDKETKE